MSLQTVSLTARGALIISCECFRIQFLFLFHYATNSIPSSSLPFLRKSTFFDHGELGGFCLLVHLGPTLNYIAPRSLTYTSYEHSAGRDAARAYATGCFQTHLTHDIRDLSEVELQVSRRLHILFFETLFLLFDSGPSLSNFFSFTSLGRTLRTPRFHLCLRVCLARNVSCPTDH